MKIKIKIGSVVTWMGSSWIVTKVGKTCCVVAKPGDPSVTGLAFRNELSATGPDR